MIFKDCHPKPPVNQLVQVYRLRHFIIPPNMAVLPKPYPARPEQCIAFYIRGSEYADRPSEQLRMHKPRLVITGQHTELLHRYSAADEFLMVQAVFFPGVLHRITGIPFRELQNGFVDLESIFPREGREVMERLQHAEGYQEMIRIIDDFIGTLYHRAKIEERPLDLVLRMMLNDPALHSVEWYAKQACLSHKQFERKSYDAVGVSPKLFTRISRFIKSYDMKQDAPNLDWLSIAITCGYHDYQHLIRDYSAFANDKPNGLFQMEALSLERRLGLFRK